MTSSGTGTEERNAGTTVRLRDAMPKPLLPVFVLLAAGALSLAIFLLVKPPQRDAVPLGERRSPPSGSFSHDVGRIAPAPIPSPAPASASVCAQLPRLRVEAGAAGQARLGEAARDVCRLTSGAGEGVARAVRALDGATLRFAAFERTGEEATTDLARRIVYLNVRFARSSVSSALIEPLLVHEGWHLANGDRTVTAGEEFRARVAELEACKQTVDRDKWIRNCEDAADLVALGEQRAVALLVAAGYAA